MYVHVICIHRMVHLVDIFYAFYICARKGFTYDRDEYMTPKGKILCTTHVFLNFTRFPFALDYLSTQSRLNYYSD